MFLSKWKHQKTHGVMHKKETRVTPCHAARISSSEKKGPQKEELSRTDVFWIPCGSEEYTIASSHGEKKPGLTRITTPLVPLGFPACPAESRGTSHRPCLDSGKGSLPVEAGRGSSDFSALVWIQS